MNNFKYAFLMGFIFLTANPVTHAQTGRKKNPNVITSGAQDRAFWVKTLYKIAYPVIHNLANNTLKINMATEVAP
ncbi:hypothetical protein, partial [Pedobacter sp.]|uniref:hypothetical protein n=1 Tax=Pedobacter sp. TaxID=1411316 RepID=UPI002B9F595F|nr:hypothetical protein [Pedobacter sp.]